MRPQILIENYNGWPIAEFLHNYELGLQAYAA